MKAGILHEHSDFWSQIPDFWQQHLDKQKVDSLSQSIGDGFQPELKRIFRAIDKPAEQIKVLILGQDPYPNPDFVTGLAFLSLIHI